jgi:ABC-type multidrug transport system fused ATPase/permease subunit
MKSIFVFADSADYAMMVIGSIAAVCNAGLIIGFREFYAQLIDESSKPSATLLDRVAEICWQLSAVGAGMAVASLIQVFLWRRSLQRQMIQMRAQLFRSILRRPVAFFDQQTPAQLQNLLSAKTNAVALRLNDQPGALVYHVTIVLAGYSWGLNLGLDLDVGWRFAGHRDCAVCHGQARQHVRRESLGCSI